MLMYTNVVGRDPDASTSELFVWGKNHVFFFKGLTLQVLAQDHENFVITLIFTNLLRNNLDANNSELFSQ